MPLDPTSAAQVTRAFRDLKIVVLGDLMLDHFIWGTVSRISPEAPVPVVKVARESFHLGGSGNVVSNLASLGARAFPLGIVGRDEAGKRAIDRLDALGVPRAGIVEIEGRATTKKTRIVAHGQQVVRFDRETEEPLTRDVEGRLLDAAITSLQGAAGMIVSDYEKGTVTASLLEGILPEAAKRGLPVVVDPKPGLYESYRPVTAITPNVSEAAMMTHRRIRSDGDAVEAAGEILKKLECRAVLLTRGDRGMLLCERGAAPRAIPATAREVYDVTGAGDTVAATFALALAAGATLADAALLANRAAAVVVAKVGTATATPEEIAGPA